MSTIRHPDPHAAQRGQVLVLFAGGLVTLLIIAALAFDVGMVLLERRDEQNAADAAALGGARYVLTSVDYSGTCAGAAGNAAVAAACNLAVTNGFDDADADEVVNIYIPPVHGRYEGFPGFIEVQIQGNRPSIFGGIIGKAVWPVGAYAVATNRQDLTFPFSFLALNPTMCKAIKLSGGGSIDAYANIQSNSSGADCAAADPFGIGFSRTGGATIEVHTDDATCRVVGLLQDQGSGPELGCTVAENSFALPDPLRNLPAPDKPATVAPAVERGPGTSPTIAIPKNCPGGAQAPTGETDPKLCKLSPTGGYDGTKWILSPGLYPGGIEVNNGTTAYLLPGIYWIGGGGFRTTTGGSVMSVTTRADATAGTSSGGVLIYNSKLPTSADGDISLGGSGATLKLKPICFTPYVGWDGVGFTCSTGEIYHDIVIYQDRSVTQTVTLNAAASNAEVRGIVYVPAGEVMLNGNGGTLTADQIIADNYLIDGGGGTINVLRGTGVDAIIVAAGLVE